MLKAAAEGRIFENWTFQNFLIGLSLLSLIQIYIWQNYCSFLNLSSSRKPPFAKVMFKLHWSTNHDWKWKKFCCVIKAPILSNDSCSKHISSAGPQSGTQDFDGKQKRFSGHKGPMWISKHQSLISGWTWPSRIGNQKPIKIWATAMQILKQAENRFSKHINLE